MLIPSLARLVGSALPNHRIVDAEVLVGGLRNSNFKVRLDPPIGGGMGTETYVLRVYEHEASLCKKEIDLHRLIHETVPVAEIVHAEPNNIAIARADDDGDGEAEKKPFVLMRYVEGLTFHELLNRGDADAIAEAAESVGETLAAIGRYVFPKSGWLEAGPVATTPLLEGSDPCPRFIDQCLASSHLQHRIALAAASSSSSSSSSSSEAEPPPLSDQVHALAWSWASRLASLDEERHLVHCDFSSRNVLVHPTNGRWRVSGVLDWEFAVSASPLIDVGHFLRYPHRRSLIEPFFVRGFTRNGGSLPADGLRLARILDLTALCEMLARPSLPADVAQELIDLIRATVIDLGSE